MITAHRPTLERRRGARLAAALAVSSALLFAAANAQADKVGVAAAVNPDAFSSLSGAPQSQINIGKSIFYNERINTTGSGLVQVLLVDGSTFTVGPGSDLVIDKFVYNPKKGTGELSASFSKGVMRFVGGKLSKNDGGVTVDTPAGALAIRGGIAYFDFKSADTYSVLFVFGNYLKNLTLNKTLFEKGYGWFMNNGQFQTRQFTTSDLKTILAALTNNSGGYGKPPDPPKQNDTAELFETQSLNQLVVDATTESIVTQAIIAANQPIPTPTCQELGNCPPPPDPDPIPVNVRVLGSPGVYNLPGFGYIDNGGDHGILGGGSYAAGATPPLADDFVWEFGILNGRLFGEIKGLTDANCNEGNCDNIVNKPVNPNPVVNFPWFEPGDCENGICQITEANNATVTQGEPRTYTGYAVRKDGFFAYQLVGPEDDPEDGEDRVLLFGGEKFAGFRPTEENPNPGPTLYKFALTQDLLESEAFGPFASSQSSPLVQAGPAPYTYTNPENPDGPIVGAGYVSDLLLLDTGTNPDQGQGVWLQTNFYLGKDGETFTGDSFINIALGQWTEAEGLTGARRGGSNVQNYSFSGDIASLAGPDAGGESSHFMGTTNPNVVIGFDSTGEQHNIGRDNPLTGENSPDQYGSTYHVGIGDTGAPAAVATGGEFKGYASGLGQQPGGGKPSIIGNFSPNDVTLSLDAASHTVDATLKVGKLDLSGTAILSALIGGNANKLLNPRYDLQVGGAGRSALIDNGTFAAIDKIDANGTTSTVTETVRSGLFGLQTTTTTYDATQENGGLEVQAYMVSADAIEADKVLFGVNQDGNPNKEFCADCEFLSWGTWGARVDYDKAGHPVITDVNLGWWVAADLAANSDISTDKNKSATYAGSAIGNVASNLDGTGWIFYVATGDLDMSWNFGKRSGQLTISEFDKRPANPEGFTWSGTMLRVPGSGSSPNQFAGVISGHGMAGAATGSFVRPVEEGIPKGVIGNWGVGNNSYIATGIFAGSKQP